MKMTKDSKGILLSEGIRLILAVIAIVILFYLAYQLYGLFLQKTDSEQAKESLNQIINKIKVLEIGNKVNYLLLVPQDWFLVYYDSKIIENHSEYKIPRECALQSCLCICPGLDWFKEASRISPEIDKDYFYSQYGFNLCEEQGVCMNQKDVFIENFVYYKESGYNLPFVSGESKTDYFNWILIPNKIYISKKDKILIGVKNNEILNNLLNQKINYSNKEMSFNEFLINISGNCQKEINENLKEKAYNFVKDYEEKLKEKGRLTSREIYWQTIDLIKINKNEQSEIFFKGFLTNPRIKDHLIVCDKDYSLGVLINEND